MNYYSQIGQDQFVRERFFQDKHDGVFVDIGAFDGQTLSNTLHFENDGWTGVCVEPVKDSFNQLVRIRKCPCENICIWEEDGVVSFMRTEDMKGISGEAGMLGGIENAMDIEHKKRIRQENAGMITEELPCLSLNSLLEKHGIGAVDYMSIDTEGSELRILKAFDFDTHPVKVLSVENNNNSDEIREFMKSKGYQFEKLMWDDIFYK